MLLISLQVEAKSTTLADISHRRYSVMDTYLQLFIDEAERLIHQGLVKKYRTNISNQTALKGKLLVHKQITRNAVHAERFYVAHQIYDRDHVLNFILKAALECVMNIGHTSLMRDAQALLLFFPECRPVAINEKLFTRLNYDRKTQGYRRAIELARIILLNYHPDLKGGSNDILAIMFDMNHLWESFIFWTLKKASKSEPYLSVSAKKIKNFWKPDSRYKATKMIPDVVIESANKKLVIDTKWKYESKPSIEDLRQLYTYTKYFESGENYLLYPFTRQGEDSVDPKGGKYFKVDDNSVTSEDHCGLLYADLIEEGRLNREIGTDILKKLGLLQEEKE